MKNLITADDFTRATYLDVNGNPRYIIHFLRLLSDAEKENFHSEYGFNAISQMYQFAITRAKKHGGRKYHNKQYGGGIIFQSYNTDDTAKGLNELIAADNTEYQGFTNSKTWNAAYLIGNTKICVEALEDIRKDGKQVTAADVKRVFHNTDLPSLSKWTVGPVNWLEIADHHFNNNEY